MSLNAENVNLNGYFNIYSNNRVEGKMYLDLSRELLGTSAKFRPLLNLLPKEASAVKFGFQLSGLLDSMNIKWMESAFKSDSQQVIPESMQRDIEEEIDEIIK